MYKHHEQLPTQEKDPKKLHMQAEVARESANFDNALTYAYQAFSLYLKANDLPKAAEALCSAVLTERHLYENTRQEGYILHALANAQVAVNLATKSRQPGTAAIPNFNLAKVQEDMGKLGEAQVSYGHAKDIYHAHPPKSHDRPAIAADINLHYLIARHKTGDHSTITEINEQIEKLKDSKEPEYTKDVWLSGAYLKLAVALKNTDIEKARSYLRESRLIIDGNPQLVLRRNQWQRIADTFPRT